MYTEGTRDDNMNTLTGVGDLSSLNGLIQMRMVTKEVSENEHEHSGHA